MTAHVVRRLVGLVAVGLLAGCGAGQPGDPDAGGPPTPSVPSSAGGGISAQEARERGVFTAEFDARLEPPPGAVEGDVRGSAEFRLVNVGAAADVYELTVDPPSAGSVEPATVELEPAGDTVVTVTLTAADQDSVLRVVSAGRGAEIAAFVLGGP
jgi:hypothetical protein